MVTFFNGFGRKISPLLGKMGPQSPHFQIFHGNRPEFQNSNPSTLLSDPDRLSVPNFVKIGR